MSCCQSNFISGLWIPQPRRLIDMPSSSHSQYHLIMVHDQHHITKFCIRCPLTSNRAAEVAFRLLVIFKSDNCTVFTAEVICEPSLTSMFYIPKLQVATSPCSWQSSSPPESKICLGSICLALRTC